MSSSKNGLLMWMLVVVTLTTLASCTSQKQTETNITGTDTTTYKNPIINKYLADPCLIFDNGYYYLFATGAAEDARYIPIHRTRDFVNWEFVRGAVAQGSPKEWNHKHFWAPEVIKIGDTYHLYYTASPEQSPRNSGNRVGLAVSNNIEGPYENVGVVIPHASIDGHPYFDKDSTMYLFYTIEHLNSDSLKAGQIYAYKMDSPRQVQGKPTPILQHHVWQEGPFLQYRFGKYFLSYSVGGWGDDTYHVRYATSSSVLGPYQEQPDTILQTNEIVKGPGHHSMYKDKNNKDWIVYHGWDTAFTARYPRIDRIYFNESGISSDGPTYNRQRLDR
jgi:beta-xylosidase